MSFPNAKILIYDTDGNLDYTLTSDVLEAEVNLALTDRIGTFSFMLPGKKGHSYVYNDIGSNFEAHIYLGYGSLAWTDLQMVGKILKIANTKGVDGGHYRVFTGKDLGHILERMLATNRRWEDLDASTIVAVDIAADPKLNIFTAGKIASDTTDETITVRTETFLDYLKKVSDYWYSAAAKVQKDFWCDTTGDLIWKARPLRTATTSVSGTADAGGDVTHTVDAALTQVDDYWNGCYINYLTGDNAGVSRLITDFDAATDKLTHVAFANTCDAGDTYTISGVETLTSASFLSYNLTYDILPVKNRLRVLGAATAPLPNDMDEWTETLTNWTAVEGTLSLSAVAPKAGTNWIRCHTDAPDVETQYYLTFDKLTTRDINKLNFWHALGATNDDAEVRIFAPDSSNYFKTVDGAIQEGPGVVQEWNSLDLGSSFEYDADENPSGIWTVGAGTPNWWNMCGVEFYFHFTNNDVYSYIDKLYFYPERWTAVAPDVGDEPTTSQTTYDEREAEYTDENLLSNEECKSRAETLLMQLDEKTIALEGVLKGNTNIRIGDRCSVTLTAENVTAVNFDVVGVSHKYSRKPTGLRTTGRFMYSANHRIFPPRTPVEAVQRNLDHLKAVYSERYSRVVR